MSAPAPVSFLRERTGTAEVSNVELFFDLVYVFAVTQLSLHLRAVPTLDGAFQAAILLGMVWLGWVYTTWVTNWLDPELFAVRLMLLGLVARHVDTVVLSTFATAVVVAVAASDHHPGRPRRHGVAAHGAAAAGGGEDVATIS